MKCRQIVNGRQIFIMAGGHWMLDGKFPVSHLEDLGLRHRHTMKIL